MSRSLRAMLPLALLVGALAGGAWWWTQRGSQPVEYVVVRGDTLSKIAKAQGVTVDELRSWNHLKGDLIEVDQVLLIHGELDAQPQASATPRKPRRARPGQAVPSTPEGSPDPTDGLVRPTPEACIPFEPELEEEGMAAPGGLSHAQVKGALDRVLGNALSCGPDEDMSELRQTWQLTIGCDGVLKAAIATDDGGASARLSGCIGDVLMHADFPAHDMADGMPVTYPINAAW